MGAVIATVPEYSSVIMDSYADLLQMSLTFIFYNMFTLSSAP